MHNEQFALDGTWCSEMGITLQAPVTFSERIPKVTAISVPGRNGDLHIYDGSFKNVKGTASCYSLHASVHAQLLQISRWLFGSHGYRRLEVTGQPDHFRLARIVSGVEEDIRKQLIAPFEIEFDCDPRKFLKSGENSIVCTNGMQMENAWFEAKPLVVLSGNGSGSFSINDVTVEIQEINGTLTLDCENENAYKGIENKNNAINAPVFPTLKPGNNTISWTGGITGATIVPRWWA